MAIDTRRFFNPSQPQTLQIAVWLLYFSAVLGIIFGSVYFLLGPLAGIASLVGCAAAGYGIANERKWGYGLGVVMGFLEVALIVLGVGGVFNLLRSPAIISFLFAVALVAALLHPMSRDYQRIWFK